MPSLPLELMKTAAPAEDVAPKILPIKQLLFTFVPPAADTNNITGCSNIVAGSKAQGDIAAAGGDLSKRINTDCRVGVTSGIVRSETHRWPCCHCRWCCWRVQQNRWPCFRVPRYAVAKQRNVAGGRIVLPVALFSSAAVPLAVFSVPVVLNKSAACQKAVFESAVLRSSAPAPTAVLKLPAVTLNSENLPIPVFPTPR